MRKFRTLAGQIKPITKPTKYIIDWDAGSRSKIQAKVKDFLRYHWEREAVFEEFPVAGTKMTLDFYNATRNVAVEVQGQQHRKYTAHFHNKNKVNFLNQLRRDKEKLEFCELNGIKLVEVYHDDELSEELFENQGVKL